MSSLPPVGGTTRRSRFAVWAAPTVSLANQPIAALSRFANMNVGPDSIAGDNRSPLSPSAERQLDWQTAHDKRGSCTLLAAGKQAAA